MEAIFYIFIGSIIILLGPSITIGLVIIGLVLLMALGFLIDIFRKI